MLFDFNFKLCRLDGTEIEENGEASICLANVLSIKTTHIKPVKAYDLAMALTKDKKIDITIDEADSFLKEVEESNLTNLAKGQLINFIKKQLIQNN